MENAHIVKSFDRELSEIESLILEMGGLVEKQVLDSVSALERRDLDLATKVREKDKQVDELETKIDETTLNVLALRQPMAGDLREVVCALKLASNLERIGDYSKNIAKRTHTLADVESVGSAEKTIKRMGSLVQNMIADVLDAYLKKDLDLAEELRMRDEEIDHMHNSLFRELLTYMMEDPRKITPCMHMLFISKNLERMGDHTTAVAEQIHYMVTGSLPAEKRPKADKTSQMGVDLEG